MPTLDLRALHLMKKALCLSIHVIERQPEGPFRSGSDLADMKDFAERLMENDEELAHYLRSALIILHGGPPAV